MTSEIDLDPALIGINGRHVDLLRRPVGDDPDLTDNARSELAARYLIRDAEGQIVETPRELFSRVAIAIAGAEVADLRGAVAEVFYGRMSRLEFLPNTPCLVNAGRPGGLGQYSACFVIPVPDTMEGVFEAIKQMALVHKTGGGTGFSFSRLRAAGSAVRSTSGVASGPISFMRPFNAATEATKQGGVRRGANMGVLRVDHPDILAFIRIKANDLREMENFNLSVGITDEFMAALDADREYALRRPESGDPVRSIRAREVWSEIIRCAHAVGDPGLFFLDRVNAMDPLVEALGPIEAPNPCGEVPLRPLDACSLGSINLAKFVSDEHERPIGFDLPALRACVRDAARFLDNMVTLSEYPIPKIREVVDQSRKIGLGVMGLADALARLGIPYASPRARILAGDVMQAISREAIRASEVLAVERGTFGAWESSEWAKRSRPPRRNATSTVIAPTGTISIIAGCSSGIEPLYALSMTRNQAGMVMHEVHPAVEREGRRHGWWSDDVAAHVRATGSIAEAPSVPDHWRHVFLVANEIDVPDHVLMQSAFQAHVEDAVSKTINMRRSSTCDDIEAAYRLAWDSGCKGITVYRDGCRDKQVLVAGVGASPDGPLTAAPGAVAGSSGPTPAIAPSLQRKKIPPSGRRKGETMSIATPFGSAHVTINEHPDDGDPFEVFVRIGKSGSEVMAWTEAFGRATSYLLAMPSPIPPRERLAEIAQQMADIGGGSQVGIGPDAVVSAPDAIAKILRAYLRPAEVAGVVSAPDPVRASAIRLDLCPSCGRATLSREQRCGLCSTCGFSRC